MAGTTASSTGSYHGALSSSTVDTITLPAGVSTVQVINRTGTAEIYYVLGPTTSPPSAPTVGGQGCFVVAAAISHDTPKHPAYPQGTVVKLISSGAMSYSLVTF